MHLISKRPLMLLDKIRLFSQFKVLFLSIKIKKQLADKLSIYSIFISQLENGLYEKNRSAVKLLFNP